MPEHRQIRGVSQFEPLYLGGSEPADGVVLVRLHVRNITPPAARDPHSEIQAALRIDTVQDGVAVNAFKLHSQLFGHFPPERIQRAFTRLDMTSGKVPHVWIPPPRRRPMTEQQLLRPHARSRPRPDDPSSVKCHTRPGRRLPDAALAIRVGLVAQGCPGVPVALVELVGQVLIGVAVAEQLVQVGGVG